MDHFWQHFSNLYLIVTIAKWATDIAAVPEHFLEKVHCRRANWAGSVGRVVGCRRFGRPYAIAVTNWDKSIAIESGAAIVADTSVAIELLLLHCSTVSSPYRRRHLSLGYFSYFLKLRYSDSRWRPQFQSLDSSRRTDCCSKWHYEGFAGSFGCCWAIGFVGWPRWRQIGCCFPCWSHRSCSWVAGGVALGSVG